MMNRRLSVLLLIAATANAVVVGGCLTLVAGSVTLGEGVIVIIATWCLLMRLVYQDFIRLVTQMERPNQQQANRMRPMLMHLSGLFGIRTPEIWLLRDTAANAFAFGPRDKGTICVTEGLLGKLDDSEIEAVLAHECAHIANEDARLSAFSGAVLCWVLAVSAVVSNIALWAGLGGWGILAGRGRSRDIGEAFAAAATGMLLAALALTLWLVVQAWSLFGQLAHYTAMRQREWLADTTAAATTLRPEALASALEKLAQGQPALRRGRFLVGSLCIVPPKRKALLEDILADHPSIDKRIAALRAMALPNAQPSYSGPNSLPSRSTPPIKGSDSVWVPMKDEKVSRTGRTNQAAGDVWVAIEDDFV